VSAVLDQLASLDRAALDATQAIRWGPLTAIFVVATAWWVKGCVFASIGAIADARARRWFPATALCALAVGLLADLLAISLKVAFDRPRPSQEEALIGLPSSPSFPSGHAMTAFAAAAFVSGLHPRLRVPLFALATIIAVSRTYLGVHYWLDIAAGAALGTAFGFAVAWALMRSTVLPRAGRAA
jgi:undecaprenyl-diphosphatase